MSSCLPVFNTGATPAEAVPADAAPSDAEHVPASIRVPRFDPASFPLSGAYSVDGMTAIPPAYFTEPWLHFERAGSAPTAGQPQVSNEPGETPQDDDPSLDAAVEQNFAVLDAQVC
jgi:hypothetical protein